MAVSTENRLGIKRLDHVGVQVRDVDRAERFYTEVLGARVLFRMGAEPNDPYGFRHTFLLLGDQRYELVENAGYRAYATPEDKALYPHYAFGVEADRLDACIAWLDEVGLPHDGPVMHPPSTDRLPPREVRAEPRHALGQAPPLVGLSRATGGARLG
jgi:catechol 2,3-dioxygenase-like lactoylglutathione lyase family enzyme